MAYTGISEFQRKNEFSGQLKQKTATISTGYPAFSDIWSQTVISRIRQETGYKKQE